MRAVDDAMRYDAISSQTQRPIHHINNPIQTDILNWPLFIQFMNISNWETGSFAHHGE